MNQVWLFAALSLGIVSSASACGCCTMSICQSMPMMMCPPPPCPPPMCPPPMPCPPPPPPPPPPICPPVQCQPVMQAPVMHTCCVMCADPCMYRRRKRDTNEELGISMLDIKDDPVCNNNKLKEIIEANIAEDPVTTKKHVQKAIEGAKLSEKYNVICAKGEFAYSTFTDDFCQAGKGDISCYVFKPVLVQ